MSRKIEVRHIDRTCLDEKAYTKLVRKYAKLKYRLIISFDNRIKAYGQYSFNPTKRIHTIKISPKRNKIIQENSIDESVYKVKTVDSNGEKYQLLSTTLHELKHALQKEERGEAFWNKQYSEASEIQNNSLADFYSECETEARTFEHTNILRSC